MDSRPMVRWWWLRGPFLPADISSQLTAFRDHGFGGVELAWVAPTWLPEDTMATRPEWLGPEWRRLVGFACQEGARLGLRVDLTFGSSWPFGGSVVPPELAARTLTGPSPHRLQGSWEEPLHPAVLDHLSAAAFEAYAAALAPAFADALGPADADASGDGATGGLFCDSFELDTEAMWTEGLDAAFERRFGYRLTADALADPEVAYDHRAMVADAFISGFVEPFATAARDLGLRSRMQAHGAPADILRAYAGVDVPESETLLFPPAHSRIAASAAALAGRPIVSCETFTCVYGFVSSGNFGPLKVWHQERVDDLRLVADAVLASGVNQVVWHGAPYQPSGVATEFYASVHVASDGALWGPPLAAFNDYLSRACALLRSGGPLQGGVAVLLGVEDAFQGGRIADDERTPGAVWQFEQRHATPPEDLVGHHPLWVNGWFLAGAQATDDGGVKVGEHRFGALVVDVALLEFSTLAVLVRLAESGAAIQVRRAPGPPGTRRPEGYEALVQRLMAAATTSLPLIPFVDGDVVPPYWARQVDEDMVVFLAHPACADVTYPLRHRQAEEAGQVVLPLRLTAPGGRPADVHIRFAPGRAAAVRVTPSGDVEPLPLGA